MHRTEADHWDLEIVCQQYTIQTINYLLDTQVECMVMQETENKIPAYSHSSLCRRAQLRIAAPAVAANAAG